MTHPPSLLDRRISVAWILAVAIGVLWHAAWFIWVVARPVDPRDPLARTTRASYVRLAVGERAGGGEDRAVRTLWSPVLFALPTRFGFSREVMDREVEMVPPLEAPAESSIYLKRGDSDVSIPEILRKVNGAGDMSRLGTWSGASDDLRAFAEAAIPDDDLRWSVQYGDVSREDVVSAVLPEGPVVYSEAAWEAVALIEIDEDGWVTGVVLEIPTESAARNRALLADLHRWRFTRADGVRRGRIALHHRSAKHAEASRIEHRGSRY